MSLHLVFGNGESRPRELPSGKYVSWGCNAIYRDLVVDNLVVIDYPMQQEVYKSGYALENKCWFTDWDILTDFEPEDFKRKAGKDVGLYITWIEEKDKVNNIDYPKGWSAGNTALHLACQDGAEEIYMLGFDGSDYNKPINNIYKGSNNYLPEDSRGFNTINWDNQFKLVQKDFPKVKFFKVGTDLTYEELKQKHTLT